MPAIGTRAALLPSTSIFFERAIQVSDSLSLQSPQGTTVDLTHSIVMKVIDFPVKDGITFEFLKIRVDAITNRRRKVYLGCHAGTESIAQRLLEVWFLY